MRRRAAEVGDPLALDQSERVLGAEHLLQDDRAAGEHRLQHIEQTPIETDWQEREQHTVAVDAVPLIDEARCAIGRVVQVQHGLRIAGGARGKGGSRQIVGMWPPSPQFFTIDRRLSRGVEKATQVEMPRRQILADHHDVAQLR